MIKPGEIQKFAALNRVKDGQVEKDYILTWVLYGVSQNKFLHDNLIFKGGTVLKKTYFRKYRYSEDLDFTLADNNISNELIFKGFDSLCEFVKQQSNITLRRETETNFESGNVNFYLSYNGPLGGTFGKKDLKIDITRNEYMAFVACNNNIYREYTDLEERFLLRCYSKEEVLIEKLRSLVERTQPRDIYDLWYLFETGEFSITDYHNEFIAKLNHKNLDPNSFLKKVTDKESKMKNMWEKYLKDQVYDLPDFNTVFRDLMKHLKKI